jgi:histidyl-tRNA synthetase
MIRKGFLGLDKSAEGVEELSELVSACKRYGLKVEPDLSLVRGLDYYTGSIFEMEAGGGVGSVAGGGRYDRLIGQFGKQDTAATGISIGIDRLSEVLKPKKPLEAGETVYIAAVSDSLKQDAIRLATDLRKAGLRVQTDVSGRGLRKQLDYVNSAGVPWVIFVGEKEVKSGRFTLRDMKTGKERKLSMGGVAGFLKS